MTQRDELRELFISISGVYGRTTPDDLKKFLEGMDAKEKERLLLRRLSETVQENILTYIISDGGMKEPFLNNEDERMSGLLNVVLDEIEKIGNTNDRLAMLMLPNELGQTPFHKTAHFHGEPELFEVLKKRLYKWGDEDFGDAYMRHFLKRPFGIISSETSIDLQSMYGIRPRDSEEMQRIERLCSEFGYQPADYEFLKTVIDKIRPLIEETLEKYPPGVEDTPASIRRNRAIAALKAFAEDPDPVQLDKTPLIQAFPGKLFDKLLDLHLKFDPRTPQELADFVVEQLSKPDGEGNPAMHRRWQYSTMMSSPKSIDEVNDSLAPVIAGFDKRFGTDIAIDMTRKLVGLKHPHPEAEGMLPLDGLDRDPKIRDIYLGGFLLNLRKELGSTEKFQRYVKEAIAPALPEDFTITFRDYEPKTNTRRYGAAFRP